MVICGLRAVMKLLVNLDTVPSNLTATSLAALTFTPKNRFIRILIPWVLRTKNPFPMKVHPEKEAISLAIPFSTSLARNRHSWN